MIGLGLRASELAEFRRALTSTHAIRVRLSVLNIDGEHLNTLSGRLLDGQVNVDAAAAVTRSMSLTLLDPRRSFSFESDSANDSALYLDRMLRCDYMVMVDGEWVDVPVFTGPITSLTRNDHQLQVVCQGKESLALSAVWRTISVKKGHAKVDAIRTILAERCGESKFDFPDLDTRLPRTLSLKRDTVPWDVCQKIAGSMNRQLFYDGRGICRLRQFPGHVFTFRDGAGGTVCSSPQITFAADRIRNAVFVHAGKPRGQVLAKEADSPGPATSDDALPDIRVEAVAPHSHPMSPWRLGRNEVPRYLPELVENSKIRSRVEARNVAKRLLNDLLREQVDATFDSLPVPDLEPFDLVKVATDEGAFSMRLRAFSLPLTEGSLMSVGQMKLVDARKR